MQLLSEYDPTPIWLVMDQLLNPCVRTAPLPEQVGQTLSDNLWFLLFFIWHRSKCWVNSETVDRTMRIIQQLLWSFKYHLIYISRRRHVNVFIFISVWEHLGRHYRFLSDLTLELPQLKSFDIWCFYVQMFHQVVRKKFSHFKIRNVKVDKARLELKVFTEDIFDMSFLSFHKSENTDSRHKKSIC